MDDLNWQELRNTATWAMRTIHEGTGVHPGWLLLAAMVVGLSVWAITKVRR